MPWIARAHPATIWIQNTPADAADPYFALPGTRLALLEGGPAHRSIIDFRGHLHRVELGSEPIELPAAILPLDRLFEVRLQAALRLWRALAGGGTGADPARLSAARRDRLLLALRALDGHAARASYREIAATLFSLAAIPKRGWKTHDLRDRTIRLVRYGRQLMQGGYRSLLLHPYRGRRHPHEEA